MKLISLNTWGGKAYQPMMDFIEKNSKDTDIFCFQEVYTTPTDNYEYKGVRVNLYDEFSFLLKNFSGYFSSTQDGYFLLSRISNPLDFEISWGLAIFAKKSLNIKSSGDFFVFRERNSLEKGNLITLPRNVQYLVLEVDGKRLVICNVHGIWTPKAKTDTPSRIEQSKKIIEFLSKQEGKKIICGDFNLDINTKSVKILEQSLINLIKEYNIERTRSRLTSFWGKKEFQKYADYTFVSPDVNVLNFEVPDLEISDHLPMILEFS